jgi:hypothetical protein
MGVFTHIRSGAVEAGGIQQQAHIDLLYFAVVAAAAGEEQRGQSLESNMWECKSWK